MSWSRMTRSRSRIYGENSRTDKISWNKGRTYDVILLTWGVNNYDVYNINDVPKEVNYSYHYIY
jgi:hypothetical protein